MTGLYLRFHGWRGFSRFNAEPDLFHWVTKAGFLTLYIEKKGLLEAYRNLREAMAKRVAHDLEGR